MLWTWVQSLVGELRSQISWLSQKTEKAKQPKIPNGGPEPSSVAGVAGKTVQSPWETAWQSLKELQRVRTCVCVCVCVRVCTHSCLTLCNPMDCSAPGSSIHAILQARILEWVAISSFRGSPCLVDHILVSCVSGIADGFFTAELPGMWTSNSSRELKTL